MSVIRNITFALVLIFALSAVPASTASASSCSGLPGNPPNCTQGVCKQVSATRAHCTLKLGSLNGYADIWQAGPRKITVKFHIAGKTSAKIDFLTAVSLLYRWTPKWHHWINYKGAHDGLGFWRFTDDASDGKTSVNWTKTFSFVLPMAAKYRVDLLLTLSLPGGGGLAYIYPKTAFVAS